MRLYTRDRCHCSKRSLWKADFVVLGQNPFETESFAIKDIPVLKTFLGGENVYSV